MQREAFPRRRLGKTDLAVSPLCLGGNVFGWTADEAQSFAILDAYVAAGGNFIDTADVYSAWAPRNRGGESEHIIGRWLKSRDNREQLVIGTKVGTLSGLEGLSARTIRRAIEGSLRRLGVDQVDIYYAHVDDPETDQLETLVAFNALILEGKTRYIGASNFSAERLGAALSTSRREGLAEYVSLETHYNLVNRQAFEGALADLCAEEQIACMPYWALASGLLSGKYSQGDTLRGPRAEEIRPYFNAHGFGVLRAVASISRIRNVPMSAIALAWLMAQPTVAAAIASATAPHQLAELLLSLEQVLTAGELALLEDVSAPARAG